MSEEIILRLNAEKLAEELTGHANPRETAPADYARCLAALRSAFALGVAFASSAERTQSEKDAGPEALTQATKERT
jgi:hypothetical protein